LGRATEYRVMLSLRSISLVLCVILRKLRMTRAEAQPHFFAFSRL
jgi:hypothetical protein